MQMWKNWIVVSVTRWRHFFDMSMYNRNADEKRFKVLRKNVTTSNMMDSGISAGCKEA